MEPFTPSQRFIFVLLLIGASSTSAAIGYWWITDLRYNYSSDLRETLPWFLLFFGAVALLAAFVAHKILTIRR